ncbi:hypothetical protein EVAR_95388_1 [Eumeta japonica]|uniref:Uncharacterized protein n=1 Tax=Eumeta variegata TaxID=151549 RepID=A0A4C1ZY50_EUMVA|nr:hypothetical protein EVAR_95388_1 [Eumeta japonica]
MISIHQPAMDQRGGAMLLIGRRAERRRQGTGMGGVVCRVRGGRQKAGRNLEWGGISGFTPAGLHLLQVYLARAQIEITIIMNNVVMIAACGGRSLSHNITNVMNHIDKTSCVLHLRVKYAGLSCGGFIQLRLYTATIAYK